MKDLIDLPADITPKAFFALVLEAMADERVPPTASPDKAGIHITGEGGGQWTMGFVDGKLQIDEAAPKGAPVQLTLGVEDWRAFVAGRVRDRMSSEVDVSALSPGVLAKFFHDGARVERVKAFAGDLKIIVEDAEASSEYAATITLGGGEPSPEAPTTTIRVTLEDAARIAKGEENPQQAFFAGKIRLDGDMNLAMGLMASMMA